MGRLSLKRVFGKLLILTSAICLGFAFAPQRGTAYDCNHKHCSPIGLMCVYEANAYCHLYEWDCWDGPCP